MRFSPDVSLNKYCSSDEEKELVREALFRGKEWIMCDAGEISHKDLFEKTKHKLPEKYHQALKNCAENWDICMQPLDGAKNFCDYHKYLYILFLYFCLWIISMDMLFLVTFM